ncbi:MAG: diguanylate cyclase [Dehalococcoidia bacterium]|nr:diguanylate cyclase [Dehalococcoidia bacterium]
MLFRRKPKDEQSAATAGHAQQNAGAAQAALRDPFGLYHLWYLELRLQEELARASRVNGVLSLATWQLKLLPGESADDELIGRVGQLISQSLRPYDVPARLDADRFAGILLDADYEDATTVAFRIKGDLQLRVRRAGRWQAGVATFPQDGVDANALIQTAFRRLDSDSTAA